MSLSVDYLYGFTLGLIRKNQSGGLKVTDFQYFWNDSQSAYFDDLIGRFQNRSNTKEGINTGLVENETIISKLTPFMIPINILVVNGQAPKPADWVYTLALRAGNSNKVQQINKDQIYSVVNSVIDPPLVATNTFYFTEYQGYYKVFPSDTVSVDLDYIQIPADVVWAFGFDGQGRQVYTPIGSVDPKWSNNSCREITKRMLKVIGVSFSSQDFENFGQSVQAAGE